MVGVVGRPAEGEFGEVAGADHEAGVHEEFGAGAGLDVLEDEIGALVRGEVAEFLAEGVDRFALEREAEGAVVEKKHLVEANLADVAFAGRDAEGCHEGVRRCPSCGGWSRTRAS